MKSLRAQFPVGPVDFAHQDPLSASGRWYFDGDRLNLDNVSARIAYESCPVAIALCDLSSRLLHANRQFQELLQLTSLESVVGQDVIEACGGQLDFGFLEALARDGRPYRGLLTITKTDSGQSRPIICHAQRIDGEEQAPRWLAIALTDADDIVLSAHAPLLHAFDWSRNEQRAGVAHWQVSIGDDACSEHIAMAWSQGARSAFEGLPTERVIRLSDWWSHIAIADRDRVRTNVFRLATDGVAYDIQYSCAGRAGGARKIMRSRGWRLGDPSDSGGFILVGTEQDVSGEYEPKELLRRALSAYRASFDSADRPAFAVDTSIRLMYGNHAFHSVFRLQGGAQLEIGAELRDLFPHLKLRRTVIGNIRRALKGERRIEAVEIIDGDACSHRYDLSVSPITADDDQILGVAVRGNVLAPNRTEPYGRG